MWRVARVIAERTANSDGADIDGVFGIAQLVGLGFQRMESPAITLRPFSCAAGERSLSGRRPSRHPHYRRVRDAITQRLPPLTRRAGQRLLETAWRRYAGCRDTRR